MWPPCFWAAAVFASPALARDRTVIVSPEIQVTVREGNEIILSARPLPGEGLDAFVQRLTEDPKAKNEIVRANEGLRRLRPDKAVNVPYVLLSQSFRKIAIEALYPEDRATLAGWEHRVTAPSGQARKPLAHRGVVHGRRAQLPAAPRDEVVGAIASLETQEGQVVLIPAALLTPGFREAVAAAAPPAEAAPPALEFATDAQGRHAVYRLRKGEALYSAVVVRFTGRVHAEDVNAKAAEIAARSSVPDVHAIPVGFPIKIPIADLAPEFRPPDDPERIEEQNARLEASQFANTVKTANLSGVTLVLDAGHGGRDTGAIVQGMEEAAYVYDIACRVERIVRARTQARVVPTVGRSSPCPAARADAVGESRSARVLTTPPYPIEDAAVGVNFRWYLANSVYRNVGKNGGHEDRTVFVSLHADSLHPAVRGTMIYVPGEKFLNGSFAKSGEPYVSRREVREAPRVSFSRREKIEAEGVSRDLAERLVASFRQADLPLHPFQPIRRNVIRGGREWVPAILRYNRIPARVLIEVCNLNNPEDRKLLRTRAYREKVAGAVADALVAFYGGTPSAPARTDAVSGTR